MDKGLGQSPFEQDAYLIRPFLRMENTWQTNAAAWSVAVSTYLALPGLRGFWTLAHVDGSGNFLDLGGNGLTLTNNNTATVVVEDLRSISYYVRASSNYLSRADEAAFDILGTETYVNDTYKGLTLGAWVKLASLPGADMTIGGKWAGGGQSSYIVSVNSTNKFVFSITGDGSTVLSVTSTASAATSTWYFVAARYTKGTPKIDLFVNTTKYTNSTSIPTSIFNSTAAFTIGATAAPSLYLDGFMCHAFLCAAAMPDDMINAVYRKTKGLFE